MPERSGNEIHRWLRAGALATGLSAAALLGPSIALSVADDGGSAAANDSPSTHATGSSARKAAPTGRRSSSATSDSAKAAASARPVVRASTVTASTVTRTAPEQTPEDTAGPATAEAAPEYTPAESVADRTVAAKKPVTPRYPDAVTAPVTPKAIVSDLVEWTGRGVVPTDLPGTPVPDLIGALWVAARKLHYRLANSDPTATYVQTSQDTDTGVVKGQIISTDRDGDVLTYSVMSAPHNGTVTIKSDGTYTYTPDPTFAHNGGTDSFTVEVSDDNPANPDHLHGLADALGFDEPTRITVIANVSPVNHAPVAQSSVTYAFYPQLFPTITGNVGAVDPDGDTLTYSISHQGTSGTATVDSQGEFTYVASDVLQDSFIVTISDARGGTTTQTVNLQKFVTPIFSDTQQFAVTLDSNAGDSILNYVKTDGTTGTAAQITVVSATTAWLVSSQKTADAVVVTMTSNTKMYRTVRINLKQAISLGTDPKTGYYGLYADSQLITLFDPLAW